MNENWFKIFAIMAVGSVAKELFGRPRPATVIHNNSDTKTEPGKDIVKP